MLPLIATIGLGLAASLGCGFLVVRALERWQPGLRAGMALGDIGLLGLLGLGTLATLANLVLPLGPVAGWPVALLGVLGLSIEAWRLARARPSPLLLGGTALILLSLAARCASWAHGEIASHYDTGLYHLQAIALALDHPAILGAANIHMRFGYNSLLFPLAATLAQPGSLLLAAGAVNSLVMIWLLMALGERLLWRRALAGGTTWIFQALLLWLLVDWSVLRSASLGNPNTDFAPRVLVPYAFALALAVLQDEPEDAAARTAGNAITLTAVVVLVVTIKLANLPALLLLGLPLLAWRRGALGGVALLACLGLGLAAGLPWLARGIMTSGCLAYPAAISCLPLPWRIDPDVARSDVSWMRAWARLPKTEPEIVLADTRWLSPWLAALPRDPIVARFPIVLVALLGGLALLRLAWPGLPTTRAGFSAAQHAGLAGIVAVSAGGVAFWFLGVPLIRYGVPWLLVPPLLLIAALAPWPRLPRDSQAGPRLAPLLVGGVAVVVAVYCLWPLRTLPGAAWGEDGLARPPAVALDSLGSLAGRPLTRPSTGDQCWNAPLFCTPGLSSPVLETRTLGPWLMVLPAAR